MHLTWVNISKEYKNFKISFCKQWLNSREPLYKLESLYGLLTAFLECMYSLL